MYDAIAAHTFRLHAVEAISYVPYTSISTNNGITEEENSINNNPWAGVICLVAFAKNITYRILNY